MVLDETAFYAESGGQVGDRGLLTSAAGAGAVAVVSDVQRAGGGALFVHSVLVQRGRLLVGDPVRTSQNLEVKSLSKRTSNRSHTDFPRCHVRYVDLPLFDTFPDILQIL